MSEKEHDKAEEPRTDWVKAQKIADLLGLSYNTVINGGCGTDQIPRKDISAKNAKRSTWGFYWPDAVTMSEAPLRLVSSAS